MESTLLCCIYTLLQYMQILSATTNEELVEIAASSEASELLEQCGCTAILSVSHMAMPH